MARGGARGRGRGADADNPLPPPYVAASDAIV